MSRTAIASLAFLAVFPAATTGQVLRVPSQHGTITAALAAATAGTTILVGPGTYAEILTWPNVDAIRLIAEAGATQTTITAGQLGTPLTFASSSITRMTLVEGFTITGGKLQNANNRNHGAGVHITGASPTLRHNRITGNMSDGPNWNYGGGIYVSGSGNPLIISNTIDANELHNGSWNYGAGIYVDSSASADIVGNLVTGNKNLSSAAQPGNRGYGAGIYAGGRNVLIASNVVVQNENRATSWNYGAGVYCGVSVTTTVVNNTIADNKCIGGNWTYGAGLYATGSSGTLVVAGNIVVTNNASGGLSQGAGGLHASSLTATVTLDWNDVWSNTGGDYVSLTKGLNDISVDPVFIVGTHLLAATSPLIDAMPASFLPPSIGIDAFRGSRRSDGNGDGLAGNGARLDIGGHEYTDVSLSVSGPLKLGTVQQFQVAAGQPSVFVLLLDRREGNLFVDPFGNLLVTPGFFVLTAGFTPGSVPLALPNDQSLAGATTWFQAITVRVANPSVGAATNALGLTLF